MPLREWGFRLWLEEQTEPADGGRSENLLGYAHPKITRRCRYPLIDHFGTTKNRIDDLSDPDLSEILRSASEIRRLPIRESEKP
jgi:hypothetical protein